MTLTTSDLMVQEKCTVNIVAKQGEVESVEKMQSHKTLNNKRMRIDVAQRSTSVRKTKSMKDVNRHGKRRKIEDMSQSIGRIENIKRDRRRRL